MKTIATAGHVDHGKSTLVSALTGIDPDRLKEEKSREMTIDLGFAWMEMPNGETLGIIDVPGHRDFIENMLAGVGGIDAVIFVVAADEGIMPQTREHLAILDLLSVTKGIIALTKVDLVESEEWLELVKADIRSEIKNTFLDDAPIISVSSKTRKGIDEIIDSLQEILKSVPGQIDFGRPRLSVDRVFSLTGFGTVVTGTLIDGVLSSGDEIRLLPSGLKGRIRGLQTHNKRTQSVLPGTRAAINISGIDVKDVQRGDLATTSDSFNPSNRIDAFINILPISSRSIKHNQEIKVFHLASERVGRIRLLGKDQILPGEEGYVQIEFMEPIVASVKDRFVIRIPSPGETVGGGVILHTAPARRYKRYASDVLKRLVAINTGTLEDKILESAQRYLFCSVNKVATELNVPEIEVRKSIEKFILSGDLVYFSDPEFNDTPQTVISKNNWASLVKHAKKILEDYHRKYPLRFGIPREEFKNKLKLETRIFTLFYKNLLHSNTIIETKGFVHLEHHSIQLSDEQKLALGRLEKEINNAPFSPPSFKVFKDYLGEELLNAQVTKKDFVRITDDIVFRSNEYKDMKNFVEKKLTETSTITVVEFRDHFNTSRKYALAFLEHLDSIGFTVRDGDFRKRGNFNR